MWIIFSTAVTFLLLHVYAMSDGCIWLGGRCAGRRAMGARRVVD